MGEAEAGRARSGGAHPTADKTFNSRRWQEAPSPSNTGTSSFQSTAAGGLRWCLEAGARSS